MAADPLDDQPEVDQGFGDFEGMAGPSAGESALMRALLPVGRSWWAIAAGYLGLGAMVLFPAPLALVTGIIAVIDIKKHPERHGMGRAIFGIVAGLIGTVLLVLYLNR